MVNEQDQIVAVSDFDFILAAYGDLDYVLVVKLDAGVMGVQSDFVAAVGLLREWCRGNPGAGRHPGPMPAAEWQRLRRTRRMVMAHLRDLRTLDSEFAIAWQVRGHRVRMDHSPGLTEAAAREELVQYLQDELPCVME